MTASDLRGGLGGAVSFDLYVWHEPEPITADQARAKLERWSNDEPGVFHANPAVSAVHTALLNRYPPLESLSDDDIDTLGVWSMTPEASDSILAISCVWSRADEVGDAVAKLAAEHGLVCYEPGYHVVNPNAAGFVPPFTLSAASLPDIPDPDDRRLDWTVRQLSRDNHFAVLERSDGWYVQVGFGLAAGVSAGTYALEYREGSADRHFRAQTTDLSQAIRFMQEFRAGLDSWKQRHGWQRLDF